MASIEEHYEHAQVVHKDKDCKVCSPEPNMVLQRSYWHKFRTGHFRERAYMYYDRYGFDHYSMECPVCESYCERFELGYSCRGKECNHG